MATRRFQVDGMTCGHCKNAVETEVAAVAGVDSAHVDLADGVVIIEGDADEDAVRAAVAEAGYEMA